VIGSISAAVTLYGMSFIYGLTGTTNLYVISERLFSAYQNGYSYIIYLAFFLMFIGLSFKISAVPNQMWAPDVYQGAPTPITAFLAVVSKAAGFAIILRTILIMFSNMVDINFATGEMKSLFYDELTLYIGIVAAASMIIGNTMALRQVNMKRLMAYSGIAQAGYLLVPFATLTVLMYEQTLFYLIAYLFANMGIFAIMTIVARDQGHDEIRGFAGLFHRSPWLAITMTIFLLSLAGIPITAGFFGKFYIFLSSLALSNYWLAGIMVATSVISYVYYFGIIKQMFMRTNFASVNKIKVPAYIAVSLIVSLIVTIYAGIFPTDVINYLHNNFFFENIMQTVDQVAMK
jgi:NADH-quinone oxidoreductase subunit N